MLAAIYMLCAAFVAYAIIKGLVAGTYAENGLNPILVVTTLLAIGVALVFLAKGLWKLKRTSLRSAIYLHAWIAILSIMMLFRSSESLGLMIGSLLINIAIVCYLYLNKHIFS